MQIQKDEDEVVRNYPEFSAPSASRPVSGETTQAEKVNHNYNARFTNNK